MHKIYLIFGPISAAIAVCHDHTDIDIEKLQSLGDPIEVREIGRAHPDTPPGLLLIANTYRLTGLRPIGAQV